MAPPKRPRSQYWCITCYPYPLDHPKFTRIEPFDGAHSWERTGSKCYHFFFLFFEFFFFFLVMKYFIYNIEKCPKTGRTHIQGYLVCHKRRELSSVKKFFSTLEFCPPIHVEPRHGSHIQAKGFPLRNYFYFEITKSFLLFFFLVYCEKLETRLSGPYSFGDDSDVPDTPGMRMDLVVLKEDLTSGSSLKDISLDHFPAFLRYGKSIVAFMALHSQPRSVPTRALYLCGPTGTGKTYTATRIAREQFNSSVYYVPDSKGSGLYWDGYAGQRVCIVDEMNSNRAKYQFWLTLIDTSPVQVPVHGGLVNFTAELIIFCSNIPPAQLYLGLQAKVPAYCWDVPSPLHRRLTTNGSQIRMMPVLRHFEPFLLAPPLPIELPALEVEPVLDEAMVDIDDEASHVSASSSLSSGYDLL